MSGHTVYRVLLGKWENKEHPSGLDFPSPHGTVQLEAEEEVRESRAKENKLRPPDDLESRRKKNLP